jgi:plasmid stabilization system protein ParE
MPQKFIILGSAQEEFKAIKQYILRDFGSLVWQQVHAEYQAAFHLIKTQPKAGFAIDALQELGIIHIRYQLVRQTRVVYEVHDDFILIHMFISTKRDFITHLMHRLFHT